MVAEQVSAQWVMDAHRVNVAEGAHQEDIAQPMDGADPGSEADVALPPTEPSIAPSEGEQPYLLRSSW